MSLWLERLNELDHYLTLRREAEQHRVLLYCRGDQDRARRVYCRALFWLGRCFSNWGEYLQRRDENAGRRDGMKRREA